MRWVPVDIFVAHCSLVDESLVANLHLVRWRGGCLGVSQVGSAFAHAYAEVEERPVPLSLLHEYLWQIFQLVEPLANW